MEEKVINIIADVLKIDDKEKITADSRLVEDLGGDSLSLAELMMELEEKFSIEISPEEAKKILKVGDVVDHLKEKDIDAA